MGSAEKSRERTRQQRGVKRRDKAGEDFERACVSLPDKVLASEELVDRLRFFSDAALGTDGCVSQIAPRDFNTRHTPLMEF
ncbi:MAG TPA: hypothetical protein VN708_22800 [Terriglobales bacterium]|nr:hypothetical protein [Terriglobales bacterium]